MTSEMQTANTTSFPLVIPTKSQHPLASLVLRNELGQVIQQWLLRQNKCTLGSANGCQLQCTERGIAPYHALIVVGARQTFVRALAPKLLRDGVQVTELLLDEPSGQFEIAGHRFELSRSLEPAPKSDPAPKSEVGGEAGRMKFALTRPLEPTSSLANPNTLADSPSQPPANRVQEESVAPWVAKLVQSAIEPIEFQLQNALGPLAELQAESRRQRRLRKKRRKARQQAAGAGETGGTEERDADESSAQRLINAELQAQLESMVQRQSIALDALGERVSDVSQQLAMLDRIANEESGRDELPAVRSEVQSQTKAIDELRALISGVADTVAKVQQQQTAYQESEHWKTELQAQLNAVVEAVRTAGPADSSEVPAQLLAALESLQASQADAERNIDELRNDFQQQMQAMHATLRTSPTEEESRLQAETQSVLQALASEIELLNNAHSQSMQELDGFKDNLLRQFAALQLAFESATDLQAGQVAETLSAIQREIAANLSRVADAGYPRQPSTDEFPGGLTERQEQDDITPSMETRNGFESPDEHCGSENYCEPEAQQILEQESNAQDFQDPGFQDQSLQDQSPEELEQGFQLDFQSQNNGRHELPAFDEQPPGEADLEDAGLSNAEADTEWSTISSGQLGEPHEDIALEFVYGESEDAGESQGELHEPQITADADFPPKPELDEIVDSDITLADEDDRPSALDWGVGVDADRNEEPNASNQQLADVVDSSWQVDDEGFDLVSGSDDGRSDDFESASAGDRLTEEDAETSLKELASLKDTSPALPSWWVTEESASDSNQDQLSENSSSQATLDDLDAEDEMPGIAQEFLQDEISEDASQLWGDFSAESSADERLLSSGELPEATTGGATSQDEEEFFGLVSELSGTDDSALATSSDVEPPAEADDNENLDEIESQANLLLRSDQRLAIEPAALAVENEDTVEDYMRRLLARMRGVSEDDAAPFADEMERRQDAEDEGGAPARPGKSKGFGSSLAEELLATQAGSAKPLDAKKELPLAPAETNEVTSNFDPERYLPRGLAPESSAI